MIVGIRDATEADMDKLYRLSEKLLSYAESEGYSAEEAVNVCMMMLAFILKDTSKGAQKVVTKQIRVMAKVMGSNLCQDRANSPEG